MNNFGTIRTERDPCSHIHKKTFLSLGTKNLFPLFYMLLTSNRRERLSFRDSKPFLFPFEVRPVQKLQTVTFSRFENANFSHFSRSRMEKGLQVEFKHSGKGREELGSSSNQVSILLGAEKDSLLPRKRFSFSGI